MNREVAKLSNAIAHILRWREEQENGLALVVVVLVVVAVVVVVWGILGLAMEPTNTTTNQPPTWAKV